MPDVAFVELPPKKPGGNGQQRSGRASQCAVARSKQSKRLTLLVENSDIATGKIDGVRGTQAGHCRGRSASGTL